MDFTLINKGFQPLQTRFLNVSALQTSGNSQQLLYPALSLSVVETVEMTLGATGL
jgi:hypothetical protein